MPWLEITKFASVLFAAIVTVVSDTGNFIAALGTGVIVLLVTSSVIYLKKYYDSLKSPREIIKEYETIQKLSLHETLSEEEIRYLLTKLLDRRFHASSILGYDCEFSVRVEAERVLVAHLKPEDYRLAKFLDEPELILPAAYISAKLAENKDRAAFNILIKGLAHTDPCLRLLAVELLGALGDDQAIIPLTNMLEDSSVMVSRAATRALFVLKNRTATNPSKRINIAILIAIIIMTTNLAQAAQPLSIAISSSLVGGLSALILTGIALKVIWPRLARVIMNRKAKLAHETQKDAQQVEETVPVVTAMAGSNVRVTDYRAQKEATTIEQVRGLVESLFLKHNSAEFDIEIRDWPDSSLFEIADGVVRIWIKKGNVLFGKRALRRLEHNFIHVMRNYQAGLFSDYLRVKFGEAVAPQFKGAILEQIYAAAAEVVFRSGYGTFMQRVIIHIEEGVKDEVEVEGGVIYFYLDRDKSRISPAQLKALQKAILHVIYATLQKNADNFVFALNRIKGALSHSEITEPQKAAIRVLEKKLRRLFISVYPREAFHNLQPYVRLNIEHGSRSYIKENEAVIRKLVSALLTQIDENSFTPEKVERVGKLKINVVIDNEAPFGLRIAEDGKAIIITLEQQKGNDGVTRLLFTPKQRQEIETSFRALTGKILSALNAEIAFNDALNSEGSRVVKVLSNIVFFPMWLGKAAGNAARGLLLKNWNNMGFRVTAGTALAVGLVAMLVVLPGIQQVHAAQLQLASGQEGTLRLMAPEVEGLAQPQTIDVPVLRQDITKLQKAGFNDSIYQAVAAERLQAWAKDGGVALDAEKAYRGDILAIDTNNDRIIQPGEAKTAERYLAEQLKILMQERQQRGAGEVKSAAQLEAELRPTFNGLIMPGADAALRKTIIDGYVNEEISRIFAQRAERGESLQRKLERWQVLGTEVKTEPGTKLEISAAYPYGPMVCGMPMGWLNMAAMGATPGMTNRPVIGGMIYDYPQNELAMNFIRNSLRPVNNNDTVCLVQSYPQTTNQSSYIYDNSIALYTISQAFTEARRPEDSLAAYKLANGIFYVLGRYGDVAYDAYHCRTGNRIDNWRRVARNSFVIIGLARFYEAFRDERALEAMNRCAEWILDYQNFIHQPVYGAFTLGTDDGTRVWQHATEENNDAQAGLFKLHQITPAGPWKDTLYARAMACVNTLPTVFWNPVMRWHEVGVDTLGNYDIVTKEYLDPNTWTILGMLGTKAMHNIDPNNGLPELLPYENQRVYGADTLRGYSIKTLVMNPDSMSVWSEGTSGASLAYWLLGDSVNAERLRAEVAKMQDSITGGAIYIYGNPSLPWPYNYPHNSIAGTVWLIHNNSGRNIFALDNGVAIEQSVVELNADFGLRITPSVTRGLSEIRYQLPKESAVNLTVYDMAGRAKMTLINGKQPAGRYTFRWDGKDAQGQALPAGTYFIRLNTGAAKTQSIKLIKVGGAAQSQAPLKISAVVSEVGGYPNLMSFAVAQATISALPQGPIRGVTYSPVPKGQDRVNLRFDYATVTSDIALIQGMGANYIRTYYPIQDERTLRAITGAGINIIMGFPHYDDRVNPGPDISRGGYLDYVRKFKGYIKMVELGNEYNLLFAQHPEWLTVDKWYKELEAAAVAIHKIDPNIVVSSAHGGLPTVDVVARCPSVDIWGINVYNGEGFTSLFSQWRRISNKPIYISETGVDSYDASTGKENETIQAQAAVAYWNIAEQNLKANGGNCLGVTFMTFSDEWWKAGNPGRHDVGGIGSLPRPDGVSGDQFNEEYWGFVKVDRTPKKVYYEMKKLWAVKAPGSQGYILPKPGIGLRRTMLAVAVAVQLSGPIQNMAVPSVAGENSLSKAETVATFSYGSMIAGIPAGYMANIIIGALPAKFISSGDSLVDSLYNLIPSGDSYRDSLCVRLYQTTRAAIQLGNSEVLLTGENARNQQIAADWWKFWKSDFIDAAIYHGFYNRLSIDGAANLQDLKELRQGLLQRKANLERLIGVGKNQNFDSEKAIDGEVERLRRMAEIHAAMDSLRHDIEVAKVQDVDTVSTFLTPEFKALIDRMLLEGRFAGVKSILDTDRPYFSDEASQRWRDLVYVEAEIGDLSQRYLQLKETYAAVLRDPQIFSKEDLVSLSMSLKDLQGDFKGALLHLGNFGLDFNLGGELGTLTDAIKIINGFIAGDVTGVSNIMFSSLALYDNLYSLYQLPQYEQLKKLGGIIIPEAEANRLFGIDIGPLSLNIGGAKPVELKLQPKIQVGLDIWIAEAQVGLDLKQRLAYVLPSLIANASLAHNNVYVMQTTSGKYLYFPVIDADAQAVKEVAPKGFYDLKQFGECINQIIASAFQGKIPAQYSAVVIPSQRQIEAYRRSVLGEEPDGAIAEYRFEADLRSGYQKIYRIARDSAGNESTELISVAHMYYPKENSALNNYETETFLRKIGEWPWKTDAEELAEPYKLVRISGLRDFEKLGRMLQGMSEGYGFSATLPGGEVAIIGSPYDLRPTVFTSVLDGTNNTFSRDSLGNAVMTDSIVPVVPYTGQVQGASFIMAVTRSLMWQGNTGKQVVRFVDNGLVRTFFAQDSFATETLPAGTKYSYTYDYKNLDLTLAKRTVRVVLATPRLVSYDEKYASTSRYALDNRKMKNKAFVFVRQETIDVPYAMVWTFRDNTPSSRFLTKTEFEQDSLGKYITVGDTYDINFANYPVVHLGPKVNKLWHSDYVALDNDGNAIPAIVEYARAKEDNLTFGSVNGIARRVPPIGPVGAEYFSLNTRGINPTSSYYQAPQASESTAVDSSAIVVGNYLGNVAEFMERTAAFRMSDKCRSLLDLTYVDLPKAQEKVRNDQGIKAYFEYIFQDDSINARFDLDSGSFSPRAESILKLNRDGLAGKLEAFRISQQGADHMLIGGSNPVLNDVTGPGGLPDGIVDAWDLNKFLSDENWLEHPGDYIRGWYPGMHLDVIRGYRVVCEAWRERISDAERVLQDFQNDILLLQNGRAERTQFLLDLANAANNWEKLKILREYFGYKSQEADAYYGSEIEFAQGNLAFYQWLKDNHGEFYHPAHFVYKYLGFEENPQLFEEYYSSAVNGVENAKAKLDKYNIYKKWHDDIFNSGVDLLLRVVDARSQTLNLTSEISGLSMSIQREREALYKQADALALEGAELNKRYPLLPAYSAEELRQQVDAEDAQGQLGQFLQNGLFGNSAAVTDIVNILGTKVDLYRVSMQYSPGSAQTTQRGIGFRTPLGTNAMNLFAFSLADRYVWKSTGPDTSEHTEFKTHRLVLAEKFTFSKDSVSINYLGYMDVALDENSQIQVHDLHIRDNFANGFFAELGAGAVLSNYESSESVYVYNDVDSTTRYIPVNILVNEKLIRGSFAFGREDSTGGMWKFIVQPEVDISNWAVRPVTPYAGVEARLPIGIVTPSVKALYAGGTDILAEGALNVALPGNMKFNVGGDFNGKYGTKSLSLSMETPLPLAPSASARINADINWTKEGNPHLGGGLTLGPVFRIKRNNKVDLRGIVTESPLKAFAELSPQKTTGPPATNIPDTISINRPTTIDSMAYSYGPLARKLTVRLAGAYAMAVPLDSILPAELKLEDLSYVVPLSAFNTDQLNAENIIKNKDGYFADFVIEGRVYRGKISGLDGKTLLLPKDYVASRFGINSEYPTVVRSGMPMLDMDLAFLENNLYLVGDQFYWVKEGNTYTVQGEDIIKAALPESAKQVIGWMYGSDTHQGYRTAITDTATLAQLYSEAGLNSQDSGKVYHMASVREGKYNVLRVKGLPGFNAKDAAVELSRAGVDYLSKLQRENYLVVLKGAGYGYFLKPAQIIARRAELTNDATQVIKLDGNGITIQRVYLAADELEVINSPAHSTIFSLGENGEAIGSPIAYVEKLNRLTLAAPYQPELVLTFDVLRRTSASGSIERVFGVNPDDGKEVAQFYFKAPERINGEKIYGKVVVDFGQTASDLPDSVQKKIGYQGNEKITQKFYFGDIGYGYGVYDWLANLIIQALPTPGKNDSLHMESPLSFIVQIKDVIQGCPDCKVWKEITPAGNFVSVRAIDNLGQEQAVISQLPEGGYVIDVINYNAIGEEIGRAVGRAEKIKNSYTLGEKLSTFTLLTGEDLSSAVGEFKSVNGFLPQELQNELARAEISVGTLQKLNDGSFTICRIKGDPLARVIAQKNSDNTWQLNTSWDTNGQPTSSRTVWNNQIIYSLASSRVERKAIFGETNSVIFSQFERAFRQAYGKAGIKDSASLDEHLLRSGITENTSIPAITIALYEKQGVTTIDPASGRITSNTVRYTDKVERTITLYLVPNDPLGRSLATFIYGPKGDNLLLHLYRNANPRDATTISFKMGNGFLGRRTVGLEDIYLFDRKDTLTNNSVIKRVDGETMESEYTSSGALARKQYPYVGHYFAGISILKKGIEDIAYNTQTPLEIPLRSYSDGNLIRNWEKVEINTRRDNAKYYVHTVREVNSLAPQKEQRLEIYYDKYGNFTGQKLLSESDSLSPKAVFAIIAGGIVMIALLFAVLSRFGKRAFGKVKAKLISTTNRRNIKDRNALFRQLLDNLERISTELCTWERIGLLSQQEAMDLVRTVNTANGQVQSTERNASLMAGEKALGKVEAVDQALLAVIFKLQDKFYGSHDEKRAFVRRVLRHWGFYLNLVDFEFTDLEGLAGQGSEFRAFLRWLEHSGANDRRDIEGFLREHTLLSIILFELLEDEAEKYFRAEAGAVRYYLIYSFIRQLINNVNAGNLVTNLRNDRNTILAFLASMKGATKDQKIISEDLRYIFKTIAGIDSFFQKAQGFAAGRINKETLLQELKPKIGRGWFKTVKDKPVVAFLINLWMPISAITLAVLGSLAPAVLKTIGVSMAIPVLGTGGVVASLIFALAFTLFMFVIIKALDRLNSKSKDNIKKDYSEPLSRSKDKVSTGPFWIFLGLALFSGIFANYWMLSWAFVVIKQIVGFGLSLTTIILGGGVGILALVFAALTFYAFAYALETVFAYYEAKKQGIRQIRSIEKAEERFAEALKRAEELSADLGEANSRKVFMAELWKAFIDILRKQEDIDNDAHTYLESWVNAKRAVKEGYFSEEAAERIQRFVEGWLMDLPPALIWEYIMPTSIVVTAYSEEIRWNIEKLNDVESGGEETILNHFIRIDRTGWELAVNDWGVRPDQKDELLRLSGLTKLSQNILNDLDLVEKIELWVNARSWTAGRTLEGFAELRRAWEIFARMCFPEDKQSIRDELLERKLQLLFNYRICWVKKNGKDIIGQMQRNYLFKLMEKYPFIEVYFFGSPDYPAEAPHDGAYRYNPQSGRRELVAYTEGVPYALLQGLPGGVEAEKGVAQGGAFSTVWGVVKFFADANASFRIEECARMPYSQTRLNEFVEDRTDYILYGEHVFPKKFSIQALCIALADEVWTRIVQRTVNMSGACSFYGHSAWTYRQIIKAVDGMPYDYPSEDIVLGMRMWVNGYQTDHREHCLFGKSRPTGWHENLKPYAKYPAGAADLVLGNAVREVMKSKNVTTAQKLFLIFIMSFYFRKPLVYLAQFLYLNLVVLLGVSGFISFPAAVLFGILGLIISQAVTSQEWLLQVEKHGFRKGTIKWFMLMPANYATFLPYIFLYAVSDVVGLLGFSKFNVTAKGLNLGWLKASEIYDIPQGRSRWILKTTTALSFISLAMLLLPLGSAVKLLAFIPLVLSIIAPFLFRIFAVSQLRAELWPEDKSKVPPVKVALLINIPLLVPVIAGIFFWRNPALLWSLPYLLAPIVSIWVFFFFQPALMAKMLKPRTLGITRVIGGAILGGSILALIFTLGYFLGVQIGIPIIGIAIATAFTLWASWKIVIEELISLIGTDWINRKLTKLAEKYFERLTSLSIQRKSYWQNLALLQQQPFLDQARQAVLAKYQEKQLPLFIIDEIETLSKEIVEKKFIVESDVVTLLWNSAGRGIRKYFLKQAKDDKTIAKESLYWAVEIKRAPVVINRKLEYVARKLLQDQTHLANLRQARKQISRLTQASIDTYWNGLLEEQKQAYGKWAEELLKKEVKDWDKLNDTQKQQKIEEKAKRLAKEYDIITAQLIDALWNDQALGDLHQALEDINNNNATKAKKALFDAMDKANKVSQQKLVDKQLEKKARKLLQDQTHLANLRQARKQISRLTQASIDTYWNGLLEEQKQAYGKWAEELLKKEVKDWDKLNDTQKQQKIEEKAKRLAKEYDIITAQLIDALWNDQALGDLHQALEDINNNNATKAKKALFDAMDKANKVSQQKLVDKQLEKKARKLLQDQTHLANLRQARKQISRLTQASIDTYWNGLLEEQKQAYGKWAEELLKKEVKDWDKLNDTQKQQKIEEKAKRLAKEYDIITAQLIDALWNDQALGDLHQALEDINNNNATKAKKALFDAMDKANKVSQQKVVDKQLEKKARKLLRDQTHLANLRQARKQINPLQQKLDDAKKDKASGGDLNNNWPSEETKQNSYRKKKLKMPWKPIRNL